MNKTLTEFLLDTGRNAALDTLADRKVFHVDEKRWDDFMTALSMPPKDNPALLEVTLFTGHSRHTFTRS